MKFDFKKLTSELYEQYKNDLNKFEFDELLNLNEDDNKDSPISTGKILTINKVRLFGKKEISENQIYSGKEIDFTLPLESGVNILIADNLKGKSSIFKIIKFALTGTNSLKPNVRKWISHTFVNFSINSNKYTVYLDLSKRSLYACLSNGSFSSLAEIEELSKDILFDATSETSYQDLINDFFFKQFDYYSLKWTQKSSQKDKNELLEANASWKTYFKSILLESKDSNSLMFGDQGKKVFQMLLGLELTYPINRLSIKKDMLNFEKAKEQTYTERQKKESQSNLEKHTKRLAEIDIELAAIQKQNKERINLTPYYNEYNSIIELIKSENKKTLDIEQKKQTKNQELNSIRVKQQYNQNEISRLNKEIEKSQKQKIDLQEFLDIGILFSNLDIKQCPSCNHDVTDFQKQIRIHDKKCSLCNESIEHDVHEIDKEVYTSKIRNLETTIGNFENEVLSLIKKNKALQDTYDNTYNQIVAGEEINSQIKDVSVLSNRLQDLEEIINSEKNKLTPSDNIKEKLVSEKAVIQFQIEELLSNKSVEVSNFEAKISLLNSAIEKLSDYRFQVGNKVLKRLAELMKNEIQDFGLTSITEVKIKDNFEIYYKQDNDFITFDNIAEGEQLRAKIAFYLSLIQLDIEFNFGRHTRLLIIDSPGKEEADSKYLDGLALVLKSIESRYGDKLQILIGTAERKLTDVVLNQKVFPKETYVF